MWRLSLLAFFIFSQLSCASKNNLDKNLSEKSEKLRLAIVHYKFEGGLGFLSFIQKMEALVQEASRKKAGLVVFPEFVVFDQIQEEAASESSEISRIAGGFNAYVNEMLRMAKLYNIHIVAGSAPRREAKHLKNVSAFLFPNSKVYFQEKIFLTSWEKEQGFKSGHQIEVLQWDWGRLVNLVGMDVSSPTIAELLSDWQPELILVPSMTDSSQSLQRVLRTAQARSVEQHSFVALSSATGRLSAEWKLVGRTSLYAPQEEIWKDLELSTTRNISHLLFVDLPLKSIKQSRRDSDFWPAEESHQKNNMIRMRSFDALPWKRPAPTRVFE